MAPDITLIIFGGSVRLFDKFSGFPQITIIYFDVLFPPPNHPHTHTHLLLPLPSNVDEGNDGDNNDKEGNHHRRHNEQTNVN